MTRQPPRLIRSTVVDLPVVEASGVAARLIDSRVVVLIVASGAGGVPQACARAMSAIVIIGKSVPQ